jgi:hypothetical protein
VKKRFDIARFEIGQLPHGGSILRFFGRNLVKP